MMLAGPIERSAIFEILQHQGESPDEPVVVISNKLLAWPHTTASYAEFAEAHNMADRPLFKAYEQAIPPDIPLLAVTYVSNREDMVELQSPTLDCSNFEGGEDAEQGDYLEILLFRLWTYNYYWQPSCHLTFPKPI
jgi:hypothetical protein